MRLAFVDDVRSEPAPNVRGNCCLCGGDMIAKCGGYVRWHWAHKARTGCDPWQESETDWHRRWKDAFPIDCQEVVHIDCRSGEKHIADVKTPSGIVIEIQHSPIAEEEARSRENFYDEMIWIIDARDVGGYFLGGMSCDLSSCRPMTYQIEWGGRSRLLERWSKSPVQVYFDISCNVKACQDEDGKLWFLPYEIAVPVQKRVLWRLLEFDAVSRTGHIAPVRAKHVIGAVMNGISPPLYVCEEEDSWRYRRELRNFSGHIDEYGNRIPAVTARIPNQ